MKHIFIRLFIALIPIVLFSLHGISQSNWDTLPWKAHADDQLQFVNKSQIPTGILYDRVFPMANADEHTGLPAYSNTDTITPMLFSQAYYEMYNSAYNTAAFIHPDSLDKLSYTPLLPVPIGMMYLKFNSIDTNALQDHLLDTAADGRFINVSNPSRSPYFSNTIAMAAPFLAEGQIFEEGDYTFTIDPRYFISTSDYTVSQVKVDFGDGQGEWIVNNPFGGGGILNRGGGFISSITKHLTAYGIAGRIIIILEDLLGQTITVGNPFKITVKNTKTYAPLTDCKGDGQKWVIEAPASRLAPFNNQYGNPQLDYTTTIRTNVFPFAATVPVKDTAYFYFAGNGSSCNKGQLKKPVVFIDGFDPTNSRNVQKIFEDYINKRVTRNGNLNTLFGDYMLSEGYDFIILDFKHGNDLLERNAMTLVSLLERLNQTYGSTMEQGITVIGPSMGSLIAQFALAYMEHNNIPHNVKTYISFDGCHQGANVPIGLQQFVEYFTKRGIFKNKKSIREGLYNGLAARQMLAHHVSSGSETPAPDALRNIFLQNLAVVGEYPQLCRKVAIINGTNTGKLDTFHLVDNDNLLHISVQRKGWKSLWGSCNDKICKLLDWNCNSASAFSRQKVMDNWTVSPLFNVLFWVALGKTNKYAQPHPQWNNSSLDNAPGGTFGHIFGDLPGDVIQSKFEFLLRETMYLITGSKRTSFSQNINQFTMMPSYSAGDLRFAQKDLYLKWDDKYLCGKTPFDYIYSPADNEQHVTVSANGSQFFENEVKCSTNELPVFTNNTITGSSFLCDEDNYTIESCQLLTDVTWTVTPPNIVNVSGTGNTARLTRIGENSGSITLKAVINFCGNPITLNKDIVVGVPERPRIIDENGQEITSVTTCTDVYKSLCPTVDTKTTILEWEWEKVTGNFTLLDFESCADILSSQSGSGFISVRVRNACGWSNPTLIVVHVLDCNMSSPEKSIILFPNPASNSVTLSLAKPGLSQPKIKAKEILQIASINEVKIYNNLGIMKLYRKFTKQQTASLDISNLTKGVYILEVNTGASLEYQQLIIQK